MAHLVFQTAFPGDLFLSIPLIKRIKEWEPETSVTLACRPGLGDYFLKSGLVDEVIEIDKRTRAGRKRSREQLQAVEWDVVFVPHQSFRTALWMRKVQARRAKVGFKNWWNFLIFTHLVQKPQRFPDALRQLSLLTPLDSRLAELFGGEQIEGLVNPTSMKSLMDFAQPLIPEWASMQVKINSVRSSEGLGKIFLAPGSVWATKRWTKKGYVALAHLLIQRGYAVELIGSPAEKILCDEIQSQVPGVINSAGRTTLYGLIERLAEGIALVANDSGAMHAAAVVGLPTVAIFGPTTLAQGFRPWQNQAVVVQRALECRPCGQHGAKTCPLGTHECMEKIAASDVLNALYGLLKVTASPLDDKRLEGP